MIKVYVIILIVFIIFIAIQAYYYSIKLKNNQKKIKEVESFENTLTNIKTNCNNNYKLDDTSLELLLSDYNKLNNKI